MASVDNGTTVSLFDNNDHSPADGNVGRNVINDSFVSNSRELDFDIEQISDIGTTILFPQSAYDSLISPNIKLYKLRGYYATGSIFETWVSENPGSNPPTGHTLTNIVIVDKWTV